MITKNADFIRLLAFRKRPENVKQKGEDVMGIFCIPWSILIIYILGCIGVPVAIELVLHTKWWKKLSDYYYSFNEKKKEK